MPESVPVTTADARVGHPVWCTPARCEVGVGGPTSSGAHRSAVCRHEHAGQVVLCWCQQCPGGPVLVAVTAGVPGVGGPVALLSVDAARGLAGSLRASAGR